MSPPESRKLGVEGFEQSRRPIIAEKVLFLGMKPVKYIYTKWKGHANVGLLLESCARVERLGSCIEFSL